MEAVRRRLRWPTRDDLREVSRLTWVFVALGAIELVFDLAHTSESLLALAVAVLGPGTFLLGAALVAIAPRQRLVLVSAMAFVALPTITLIERIIAGDLHDVLRMPLQTYENFSMLILSVTDVLRGFGWLYELIALLALAFYIGTIHSRRGAWIVALGVVLAVVSAAVSVANLAPFWTDLAASDPRGLEPFRQVALIALGRLPLVATAYLMAVALDRPMRLIPLAIGLSFADVVLSLLLGVAYAAIDPQSVDGIDALNNASIGLGLVFGVAYWVLFIGGVLLELPRNKVRAADTDEAEDEVDAEEAPVASSEAFSGGN